jgi:adenylyltransferase/sulfurtransferase
MTSPETTSRARLDFQTDRQATLKLIDWFDVERVHAANILVVGAGAIGNEVLKNLALLGVGNIYILDRDSIEISNLSRSILYRAEDAGQHKAPTAARALREINPNVAPRWKVGDLSFDLGLGVLRRMDVVIGCLDNIEARFKINRDCRKVGRPWIDAGIGALNGYVQAFSANKGPCYECSFSPADYEELPLARPCNTVAKRMESEGKIPTMPTIASIVAGVQAQEALKLLDFDRWDGRTLLGRQFTFDGTVGDTSIDALPERDQCPAHDGLEPDLLVELHDATAERTKASQLLEEARARLGPTATLELNFELAVEMKCPKCRQVKRLLTPVWKLQPEHLVCGEAECRWECNYESDLITTHTIGGDPAGSSVEFLALTLAELCVPALDILEAQGPHRSAFYFELTGDAAAVFNVENRPPENQ